jgi:hypothetical protein
MREIEAEEGSPRVLVGQGCAHHLLYFIDLRQGLGLMRKAKSFLV